MNKSEIIGVVVLYNDGARAADTISSMKTVCDLVFLIHDGKASEETKRLISGTGLPLHEWPRRYCKEAHLVHFFDLLLNKKKINNHGNNFKWCLHLDTDEYLDKDIIEEIKALTDINTDYIVASANHKSPQGLALQYTAKSNRVMKPVLINLSADLNIIGLPHKGIIFEESASHVLENPFVHNATHISGTFLSQLKKELQFAKNDSIRRTEKVSVLNGKNLISVLPTDGMIPFKDRLLNKYPLAFSLPAAFYSAYRSLISVFEARGLGTVCYELKMLVVRALYYLKLAWLIKMKRNNC